MKKIFLFLFSALAFSTVHARVRAPVDFRGTAVTTVDWVGAIPCGVDSSTGTNAVLCASGRSIIYGVIISSVAATDFLVIRDSATANTTSTALHAVWGAGTGSVASGASTTQLITFPKPLKVTNGISINASVAPGSTRSRWTLLYRPMDDTGGSVTPAQDYQGYSLHNVNLVGTDNCNIGVSTGLNPVLCTTGRIAVYGVIASSVPTTDFIVFRDTATNNQTSSTATIVYANGTGASATGVATQTFLFPVPIRFSNGLNVNAIAAPTSPNGPGWTVIYRKLTATE